MLEALPGSRLSLGLLFMGSIAALAIGCTSPDVTPSRDDARSMAGSAADSGRDLCEEYGWYGDGAYCDEFCPHLDPDCAGSCTADADCPPIFCASGDCATTSCVAGSCAIADDCTATLAWLQKDAYKSEAGRSTSFWPPHTTMTLTVSCGGETVREAVAVNHGTAPDALDAAGTVILERVWSDNLTGSRAELLGLADAFEGCECGNTFLSLDALDASLVNDLVAELAMYLSANLTCPDTIGGTPALVDALLSQNLDFVLANGASCSWASGASWEEGLNEALGVLAESSRATLADYHVCNNDAMLQADLFERFRAGDVSGCDGGSSLCAGPSWLYDPAR